MKRLLTIVLAAVAWLNVAGIATAQQEQPPARVEAKRDVVVNWTLGDQVWVFKDILTAYEPVRGYTEPRENKGTLAVWKLRLVKDFEDGASLLHTETRGSPFKIVLLDAERTIIDPDVPAQITPVPGKMDDTIELLVGLPDAQALKDAKMIRVQRRTDVGF